MKNKASNLLIAAFAITLCYTTMAYCDPIEVLFKNREHLRQWFEGCNAVTEAGKQHLLLFSEISQKELYHWKGNNDQIVTAFLEVSREQARGYVRCTQRSSSRRLDSMQIRILISILNDTDDERVMPILKIVPYPYINQHRNEIVDMLKKGNNINRFSYLASIIDPPTDMKDKLLASDKLSTGLRARLGDKEIERELIQKVNAYSGDKNIGRLVDDLFQCGTNECLKAVFELFVKYESMMTSAGDCALNYSRGVVPPYDRSAIVRRFRMYYPDLPLLHETFIDHSLLGIRPDWDVIVEYMDKFVKWGNKEFRTNVKLENYFLFPGQCEPMAHSERMIRERKGRPNHEKLMKEHSVYRDDFLKLERELDSLKRTRRPPKK